MVFGEVINETLHHNIFCSHCAIDILFHFKNVQLRRRGSLEHLER